MEEEIADEFLDKHIMILKAELNDDETWYADYVHYIVGKIVPPNWTPEKRRFFSQVKNYFWDEPYAFRLCPNNVMKQCVARSKILEILVHCYSGPTRGHHSASITGRKVYEFRFFWPSIFKYAKDYVMRCDACQRSGNISSRIAVDYVSKWVEAQALPTNDARFVIKFLRKLFARFGVPKALISDRGTHFCNSQIEKALQKYEVTHKLSTAYHPQTNGQTEVTNKAIKRILKRSVGYSPKNWFEKLDDALWAFRTAYKTPTRCTPLAAAKNHFMELNELMELRDGAYENTCIYKERTKKWHDSRLRGDKNFNVGDKVLLFNSRFKMHPVILMVTTMKKRRDHMDHNSGKPNLGASVSVMPLSTYLNLGLGELAHTKLTVELADMTVKYPKGIAENVLVGICKFTFLVDFIILDMPEDIKVPLILGRTFLSTAHAKIDVYKRKITLRVREERIVFTSIKPASSLIKRVYMLSLRERMELDLEVRLMGETLVNQGDDLMPTIEEDEVIKEFKTRDDELNIGIDDYPISEDMDAYRDEGIGDVIFGEPFLKFKRHTNEQCNKIPPLLKVSEKDEKNRISHAYQKLKGFYKGVLNLGPDYIRDAKTEEWLTRGHISVHEME
ncbi:reverse transcriptase domain-containing protein [Tanacetum coccineum]